MLLNLCILVCLPNNVFWLPSKQTQQHDPMTTESSSLFEHSGWYEALSGSPPPSGRRLNPDRDGGDHDQQRRQVLRDMATLYRPMHCREDLFPVLYEYYQHRGFAAAVLRQLASVVVVMVVGGLPSLLALCVDWHAVLTACRDEAAMASCRVSVFFQWPAWTAFSTWLLLLYSLTCWVYAGLLLWTLLSATIPRLWRVRLYWHKILHFHASDWRWLTWHHVLQRLCTYDEDLGHLPWRRQAVPPVFTGRDGRVMGQWTLQQLREARLFHCFQCPGCAFHDMHADVMHDGKDIENAGVQAEQVFCRPMTLSEMDVEARFWITRMHCDETMLHATPLLTPVTQVHCGRRRALCRFRVRWTRGVAFVVRHAVLHPLQRKCELAIAHGTHHDQATIQALHNRLRKLVVLLLCLLPLTCLVAITYLFLRYAKMLQQQTSMLFTRQWSASAVAASAAVGELPEEHEARLAAAAVHARQYLATFRPSACGRECLKLVGFGLSALLALFLILTLLNDAVLVGLQVLGGHKLYWVITVLSVVWTMVHSASAGPVASEHNNSHHTSMEQQRAAAARAMWEQLGFTVPGWQAHTMDTRRVVLSLFPSLAEDFLMECAMFLALPYICWQTLPERLVSMLRFMETHTWVAEAMGGVNRWLLLTLVQRQPMQSHRRQQQQHQQQQHQPHGTVLFPPSAWLQGPFRNVLLQKFLASHSRAQQQNGDQTVKQAPQGYEMSMSRMAGHDDAFQEENRVEDASRTKSVSENGWSPPHRSGVAATSTATATWFRLAASAASLSRPSISLVSAAQGFADAVPISDAEEAAFHAGLQAQPLPFDGDSSVEEVPLPPVEPYRSPSPIAAGFQRQDGVVHGWNDDGGGGGGGDPDSPRLGPVQGPLDAVSHLALPQTLVQVSPPQYSPTSQMLAILGQGPSGESVFYRPPVYHSSTTLAVNPTRPTFLFDPEEKRV